MNAVYFHLVLNHVPAFLLILSLILQIYYLQKRLGVEFNNALIVNIINLFCVFLLMRSGELSQIAVESIINIDTLRVEEHAIMAQKSFTLSIILGLLSTICLLVAKFMDKLPIAMKFLVLLMTLLTVIGISLAAHLGVLIRHPEIREVI